MAFKDGPKWNSRGVGCKNLPLPQSFIDFKREFSNGRGKKAHEDSDGEGDGNNSPKRDWPPQDKGNGKKEEALKMYSCFLGNKPHCVFECPKHGKLAALVMEEEKQEKEGRIALMSLLSVIQIKVGEKIGGCMNVKTELELRNSKPQWIEEEALYIWKRSLMMRFAFLTQRKRTKLRESTQKAYQPWSYSWCRHPNWAIER